MPTARELLEQADALMRRNRPRTAGEPGRAVSPPAAANSPEAGSAPLSPRPIQREPVPPPDALSARPERGRAPPPPAQSETDVPVLTDAVPEPAEASELLDTSELAAKADAADDVPLLTDAVEEIDVGIVDEAARGEPSYWELTARGETSVLGRAPDSVAVVPPPDLPPPGRDPLGLDQPARGFVPSPTATAAAAEAAKVASGLPPLPASIAADDGPPADDTLIEAASAPDDPAEFGEAALLAGQAAAEASAPLVEEPNPSDPTRDERVPDRVPMDDARIREAAEEISMQVLQRIDIFADTTLRVELGERLKPAVERVSAELVAHINQQVGELLRAFVAEAIEREIENWRDRNPG